MDTPYWLKQTPDTPLFPDLLWSRPENKAFAGKLLIAGGHAQSFAAPAEAYGMAHKAGIGVTRVLLPDALQRTVSKLFPEAEYAASTPSGSFSRKALVEFLDMAAWADGVLLAGDLGNNSETAVLLEQFAQKFSGQLTLTRDAVNYVITTAETYRNRPDTLLVLSYAQLQRLAVHLHFPQAFTFDMDFLRLIEQLHIFSSTYAPHLMVRHLDTLMIAVDGQVSTTRGLALEKIWRLPTAAAAAVWWLQNPSKPMEALSTAILQER